MISRVNLAKSFPAEEIYKLLFTAPSRPQSFVSENDLTKYRPRLLPAVASGLRSASYNAYWHWYKLSSTMQMLWTTKS